MIDVDVCYFQLLAGCSRSYTVHSSTRNVVSGNLLHQLINYLSGLVQRSNHRVISYGCKTCECDQKLSLL